MDPARLRAIRLFADLPDEDLRRLAAFATEESVATGTVLVREGDFSTELVAIEEGTAEVLRGGARVSALGQGDVFGEIGVLANEARTATVVATTSMLLTKLDHWNLKRMPRATVEQLRSVAAERRRHDAESEPDAGS